MSFYQEFLDCDENQAANIENFMRVANQVPCVIEPKPWANYGKARVYFDLWSQNKMAPCRWVEKTYYDADLDDVIFYIDVFGKSKSVSLKDIFNTLNTRDDFSGAKTRRAIEVFQEVFYEQQKVSGS